MGKKQAVQKQTVRVLLENPLPVSCPTTSETTEKRILDLISKLTGSTEEDPKKEVDFRKEVVFGLNAVSRHAERGSLCAALVARPVQPLILCQHLTSLCSQKGLPLLAHSQLNLSVAKMFRLSSLLTLGLKRSAEDPSSPLNPLFTEICKSVGKQKGNSTVPSDLENCRVAFAFSAARPPSSPLAADADEKLLGTEQFIRLNQHPVFPDPDYPKEVDSLAIKVGQTEFEPEKIRASDVLVHRTPVSTKRKFFLDTQLKTVVSSGRVKKPKRKNRKHNLKK